MKKEQNSTAIAVTETTLPSKQPIQVMEQSNADSTMTITTPAQRNVSAVFEKIQQGQMLQEKYQNAKGRLAEIESFKNAFDGSGLELIIVNRDGHEIKFRHQESILKFLENQLESGKEVLGMMEANIVNFSI